MEGLGVSKHTQNKPLGQLAYEAYCGYSKGKSLVTGHDLPTWELTATPIQEAWQAAADAAAQFTIESIFPPPEGE